MFNDGSRLSGDSIDLRTVTEADYDEYRIKDYDLEFPLGLRRDPTSPSAHVAQARLPTSTPAQLFERGIKKDKDHYNEFKDEKA